MSFYREAGDMYGDGLWDDVTKFGRRAFKAVQSNPTVRSLEKQAVQKGATALRGLADGAASELGPVGAMVADTALSKLEKKGVDYLDQKIDQSGKGVRYMGAAGGGMRVAGSGTQIGRGMRLASGAGMRADGLRVAGAGLRVAGSGMYIQPGHLVRGSGHACACC